LCQAGHTNIDKLRFESPPNSYAMRDDGVIGAAFRGVRCFCEAAFRGVRETLESWG
jgi:hypothetical protein